MGRPVLKHFKIQMMVAPGGHHQLSTNQSRRLKALMTDDTLDNFTCNPDTDTINLEGYLNVIQLPPSPLTTFQPSTNQQQAHLIHHHSSHDEDHTEEASRKRMVDRILHFYDKGVKQFWEDYAGQSNLSEAVAKLGYEVNLLIIDVSSSDYSAEYLLTWRGWWSTLQNLTPKSDDRLHACSVKEIIKNMFM